MSIEAYLTVNVDTLQYLFLEKEDSLSPVNRKNFSRLLRTCEIAEAKTISISAHDLGILIPLDSV